MRLLLDTHAFLWFAWDHPRLSARARSLMADPDNELLLSAGSLWEAAVKASLGKLVLAEPFEAFIRRTLAATDIALLPICVAHVAGVVSLPFHHRDPFDRLLVAQALSEKVPLLSTDQIFDAYGVTRMW